MISVWRIVLWVWPLLRHDQIVRVEDHVAVGNAVDGEAPGRVEAPLHHAEEVTDVRQIEARDVGERKDEDGVLAARGPALLGLVAETHHARGEAGAQRGRRHRHRAGPQGRELRHCQVNESGSASADPGGIGALLVLFASFSNEPLEPRLADFTSKSSLANEEDELDYRRGPG